MTTNERRCCFPTKYTAPSLPFSPSCRSLAHLGDLALAPLAEELERRDDILGVLRVLRAKILNKLTKCDTKSGGSLKSEEGVAVGSLRRSLPLF